MGCRRRLRPVGAGGRGRPPRRSPSLGPESREESGRDAAVPPRGAQVLPVSRRRSAPSVAVVFGSAHTSFPIHPRAARQGRGLARAQGMARGPLRRSRLGPHVSGNEARARAERPSAPFEAPMRLARLNVLDGAAREIPCDLAPGSVVLGLRSRGWGSWSHRPRGGPRAAGLTSPGKPPSRPTSPHQPAAAGATQGPGGSAREARESLSVNAWLASAAAAATEAGDASRPQGGARTLSCAASWRGAPSSRSGCGRPKRASWMRPGPWRRPEPTAPLSAMPWAGPRPAPPPGRGAKRPRTLRRCCGRSARPVQFKEGEMPPSSGGTARRPIGAARPEAGSGNRPRGGPRCRPARAAATMGRAPGPRPCATGRGGGAGIPQPLRRSAGGPPV